MAKQDQDHLPCANIEHCRRNLEPCSLSNTAALCLYDPAVDERASPRRLADAIYRMAPGASSAESAIIFSVEEVSVLLTLLTREQYPLGT